MIKIRFWKHEENVYTMDIKHWYGWKPVYKYGGAFNIHEKFRSKKDGLNWLKYNIDGNPYNTKIIEYPTILKFDLK